MISIFYKSIQTKITSSLLLSPGRYIYKALRSYDYDTAASCVSPLLAHTLTAILW
jgi:hypothetical protein